MFRSPIKVSFTLLSFSTLFIFQRGYVQKILYLLVYENISFKLIITLTSKIPKIRYILCVKILSIDYYIINFINELILSTLLFQFIITLYFINA